MMRSPFDWIKPRARAKGGNLVLTLGMMFTTMFAAPFAIDLPNYFAVKQQLQTATDAAALAAAAALPNGQSAAESAAYSVAGKNLVNGKTLGQGDLTFSYSGNAVRVVATTNVNTITAPFLCGFQIQTKTQQYKDPNDKSVTVQNCSALTMTTGATAEPAARDTVLVIDTSSSMSVSSGNTTLLASVQKAATNYVDYVAVLNNKSVDRIALVNFDQKGVRKVGLTSLTDSPNFSTVRTGINGLKIFSGTGWNTNYQIGLQLALDELQNNGRSVANKQVIFMTDGYANLPAPSSYYSYDSDEPYTKCTDMVDNSQSVLKLCSYNSQHVKVCPQLPSTIIPDSLISSSATQCAVTYTDYMESAINAQTDRADSMGVVITTIRIYNSSNYEVANETLQRLLKDQSWDSGVLPYMSAKTDGQSYSAQYYDPTGINNIYTQIAQKIRVKLSS